MLSQLRNVNFIKGMMLLVAVAFVGLIVFKWGADVGGRSGGRQVGDTVGIINGQKISYQDFDRTLRRAYLGAKEVSQGDPELAPLIQEVWDRIVAEMLFAEQIEKLGISVSSEEIDAVNRIQPIQEVQNAAIFQTDGRYDPVKYADFLNAPSTYSNPRSKQFVLAAEQAVRRALLTQKLQGLVASGAKVTTGEVREVYARENEKVKVGYIEVPLGTIADSLVQVDDAQIEEYYETHLTEFHEDGAVGVSFVTISKTPSAQDELDVVAEIRDLLEEARSGEDFDRLAEAHSEDPGSAVRGGDLGFFGKGRMVKAFEDSAFALDPGQISQPFQTRFGWHILKVEERKGEGDSLEVRARHILLRITPGRNTQDSLSTAAEQLQSLAEEIGFDQAAARMDLKPQDSAFFSAGAFFPLLGNRTNSLVRSFLGSEPGAMSNLYHTDDGIHLFFLRAKRDAGPRPISEVRGRILSRLKRDAIATLAADRLEPVLRELGAGASLSEAAGKTGFEYVETDLFGHSDFVPRVGGRNAFVGVAFQTPLGQVSEVIKSNQGAYLLEVLERKSVEDEEFEIARPKLAQRVLSQKVNEALTAWFENLKSEADIEDNRHQFYSNF